MIPVVGETMDVTTSGRPRAFDADLVLDQAVELFWLNGYRSTTTRELEAQLGLSQSSLYNAFGSKAQLLDAALDRYQDRTEHTLLVPLEASPQGLNAIDAFFVELAEWVTNDGRRGCMIINLMAEDGGDSVEITARTTAYRSRVRSALLAALQRAADRGETGGDALELRADLLFGEVLGLNIAARGGAESGEVDRLVAGARHLIESWRS